MKCFNGSQPTGEGGASAQLKPLALELLYLGPHECGEVESFPRITIVQQPVRIP